MSELRTKRNIIIKVYPDTNKYKLFFCDPKHISVDGLVHITPHYLLFMYIKKNVIDIVGSIL